MENIERYLKSKERLEKWESTVPLCCLIFTMALLLLGYVAYFVHGQPHLTFPGTEEDAFPVIKYLVKNLKALPISEIKYEDVECVEDNRLGFK